MKKILCLFFALCACAQLVADQTMTWAAPVQLSSSGVDSSSAVVSTDPSGNVTAVWVENGNIMTNYLPFGGSWGMSSTTLDSSGTASLPKVGMDSSGNAVAIWLTGGVVKAATQLSGGSWSVATSVSSGLETALTPRLAVDGSGNAVVTWANSAGAVEVATKLFGQSWSLVSTLSSSNSDRPDVAIGNGVSLVVWHNLSVSGHQIQSNSATVGGSWEASPKNVIPVATALINNYPRVTLDNAGNATVVWFRYVQQGSSFPRVEVIASTLLNGSASWLALPNVISNIGQTDPSVLSLRVKADSLGNVVAMWMQSTDGANFSFNANAQPFGGSWQGPAQISNGGVSGTNGDMEMNSLGDAVAVFMAFDGMNAVIQSADSFFGGFIANDWTIISTASTGSDNGFPRIATFYSSGTIYATAVWTQFNGSNTIINAATGARVMLLPPSSVMITQNLTDYGVFKDYYNTVSWTGTTDPNAVGYILFRNGAFLASLGLGQTSFVDSNQLQNGPVTYSVAAIDGFSQLSPLATQSFP